jgi:hypothetical protein
MQISPLVLSRQFSRFDKLTRSESGEGFISFREGLPWQWEGYKEGLRNEALYRLNIASWKRNELGKGRILDRVIDAIEINVPRRHIKNNFVDWPNRYGHKHLSHRTLLDAKRNRTARYDIEKWFFTFFKMRKSDEKAFEEFRKLAGNRYDLVAYLFFLKDWDRFMPIATRTFDKAFRSFDIDLVTSGRCSWDNYLRYNESLLAIRRHLRDVQGIRDARLVDAHSFCWMLMRLKAPSAPPRTVIPMPVQVTTLENIIVEESDISEQGEFTAVDEEDFLNKQARNRELGKLAQDIALQSERKRLDKLGISESKAVRPVWDELKRGYDILSHEVDGKDRLIEVKAARTSGKRLSFFLTAYEWRVSQELPNYYFYLVLNTRSSRPAVLMIEASKIQREHLKPTSFLSTFAARY